MRWQRVHKHTLTIARVMWAEHTVVQAMCEL